MHKTKHKERTLQAGKSEREKKGKKSVKIWRMVGVEIDLVQLPVPQIK